MNSGIVMCKAEDTFTADELRAICWGYSGSICTWTRKMNNNGWGSMWLYFSDSPCSNEDVIKKLERYKEIDDEWRVTNIENAIDLTQYGYNTMVITYIKGELVMFHIIRDV